MLPIPSSRPDVRPAAPLHVTRIRTADELAAMRPDWNALLRDSRADSVFLTWEWLSSWWAHLGTGELNIVVVRAGDEVVGIAPLVRTRAALPWLSRLEFLGTGCAGSDYLDVIVRHGREEECLDAIASALLASNQTLHLDHLPPQSTASGLMHRVTAKGWTSIEANGGTCPFIPLRGQSWESYLATVGPAHRANFRRRLRTLTRDYRFEFARVSSETERRDALCTLIRLHNQRWDARGGSTAFRTAVSRAFHEDATRRALDAGWLRLYVLRLNDVAVASTYCFAYNGRFYFYQGAFDDAFRKHSVGMVAMGLTIQAAIEEGAREFDLLYGVESYKWLWARDARPLGRIDLFPAGIAGRLHHHTVTAERTARRLARRMVPRKTWSSNVPPVGAAC
jgi:CelD/BcsL family acetyltransferase involved in cellulose biosynthesis